MSRLQVSQTTSRAGAAVDGRSGGREREESLDQPWGLRGDRN